MKHPLLILIFSLLLFQQTPALSQNTDLDTVFIKKSVGANQFEMDTLYIPSSRIYKQVLAGTTFLPYSEKMNRLLNNGIFPISLEVLEECGSTSDPSTFRSYPKFIEAKRDADVLTIDVAIVANCCVNFLGEAEVTGKDTLNLVYTTYGGFCFCECCFTLRYKFDTALEANYQILKFVTINGSKAVGKITNGE